MTRGPKRHWRSCETGPVLTRLLAPRRRLVELRRVLAHLQAHEHLDIAGVAAGLGGREAALPQRWRELRPLLLQLVARAALVRETLPQRRIQAQLVAHLRRRTTGGFDVEGRDGVGRRVQQRGTERKGYGRW